VIRFALRRIGWAIVVAWFVATLTFLVVAAIPADPAHLLLGPHATAESLARARAHYCLDHGLAHQYGCWLGHLVRGDLGESYRSKRAVTAILSSRLWPTLQLALAAIALQLAIGVPLGVAAAIRRGRWPDHVAQLIGLVAQSAPPYFVGSLLLYLFGYRLGWLPLGGYGAGGWDRLVHLVLPALSVATLGVALYARVAREELIDALGCDYVRTARAKGLPERSVIGRHALAPALGPLVTLIGLDLGLLLGGAVVTEVIFTWPGIGREVMQAILELDIPVILGVVLASALAIAVVNLVVDLVHAWLDPRLRDG
jgi:peptide/nickel transport system permease protein